MPDRVPLIPLVRSLVLLGMLLVGRVAPASPVLLTLDQDVYPLAASVTTLHDPGAALSLDDVRARQHQGGFSPLPDGRSNFGYVDGAMWFHARVANTQAGRSNWMLVIEYALLDHVTLFQVEADGRVSERLSGDRTPFATRGAPMRNLNFRLQLRHDAPTDLYLRVVSQSSMQVPLVLARPDAYFRGLLPEYLGLGLYYGVLLALLMYNLILWLSVRDRNFLWYVLYVASLGALLVCLNGFAFQFLWPDSPDWANLAVPLSLAASNLCMLQFTRSFLELRRFVPRADLGIRIAMALVLLPALAAFVLPYRIIIQYQTVVALLLAPTILVCALLSLRHYAPARHFLLAWAALLAGVVIYSAVSLGLLPKTPLTEFSLQIGSAAEMILLSFALAYRINLLTSENQRIQSEAREQLEARVRARTAELDATLHRLEDANRRLQDFSRRDGLTGVYNRRHFDDLAVQACQQARERGEPLSLLMIDVDHFKPINDRHGHQTGDDCLRAIAQTLDRIVRSVGGAVARYGGEEFAVVLPGTALSRAHSLAETLRMEIAEQRVPSENGPISLTISLGLYGVPAGYPCTAAELLRHADAALYAAKRGGRNRIEITPLM